MFKAMMFWQNEGIIWENYSNVGLTNVEKKLQSNMQLFK